MKSMRRPSAEREGTHGATWRVQIVHAFVANAARDRCSEKGMIDVRKNRKKA